MAWLRPILLLAGALFIALLVWWERRRPRQAPDSPATRAERSEPALDPATPTRTEQDTVPPTEAAPLEYADTRDRELHRAPPVIDWSEHTTRAPGGTGGHRRLILWPRARSLN